jgi:hypothetical protein
MDQSARSYQVVQRTVDPSIETAVPEGSHKFKKCAGLTQRTDVRNTLAVIERGFLSGRAIFAAASRTGTVEQSSRYVADKENEALVPAMARRACVL